MDDLEESTNISSEVHRVFFLVFIDFGSTTFYKKHVNTPIKVEEARSHMREFSEAGFPGCIGSIDCTHIGNAGIAGISVGLSLKRHMWHTAIPFSSLVVVKICFPLTDSNDESKLPFNSLTLFPQKIAQWKGLLHSKHLWGE